MSDKQGLESALHMQLASTGPKLIWSEVMNVCLHQSAVTFSDLSRNVLSALRAGCDTALFFFIIIICKLCPTHMENSHISQTPSYSPRLDSSQQLGNDRSIPLRAVSTRLKTGPC